MRSVAENVDVDEALFSTYFGGTTDPVEQEDMEEIEEGVEEDQLFCSGCYEDDVGSVDDDDDDDEEQVGGVEMTGTRATGRRTDDQTLKLNAESRSLDDIFADCRRKCTCGLTGTDMCLDWYTDQDAKAARESFWGAIHTLAPTSRERRDLIITILERFRSDSTGSSEANLNYLLPDRGAKRAVCEAAWLHTGNLCCI
jgi:hypothetical protein